MAQRYNIESAREEVIVRGNIKEKRKNKRHVLWNMAREQTCLDKPINTGQTETLEAAKKTQLKSDVRGET